MHLKTVRSIPVAFAILGAICGALLAMLGPDMYASSAVIQFRSADAQAIDPRELQVEIQGALSSTELTLEHTTLERVNADADETAVVRMTYNSEGPAEALRGAENFIAALASATRGSLIEIRESPQLPKSPIPHYGASVAGGLLGLAFGVVLLIAARRSTPRRA